MSKKSWFKGLKKTQLPEAAPRSLDDIQKSYREVVLQVGQAQYQAYVYGKEVERLNKVLESLNKEGAARQTLDKEAPQATPAPAEAKPTTSEATSEQA